MTTTIEAFDPRPTSPPAVVTQPRGLTRNLFRDTHTHRPIQETLLGPERDQKGKIMPLPPRQPHGGCHLGLATAHKQTELDLINGKFIQNVFMCLQKTSRELALAMHSGPFGGIQGKADVVLWNMRHGDEVSNTSQDILNLVELIRYCAPCASVWLFECTRD
jgi:hypothetical protein